MMQVKHQHCPRQHKLLIYLKNSQSREPAEHVTLPFLWLWSRTTPKAARLNSTRNAAKQYRNSCKLEECSYPRTLVFISRLFRQSPQEIFLLPLAWYLLKGHETQMLKQRLEWNNEGYKWAMERNIEKRAQCQKDPPIFISPAWRRLGSTGSTLPGRTSPSGATCK